MILESLSGVFAQSANSIRTLILSKNNLTNDELIDAADILADCTGMFVKLKKRVMRIKIFKSLKEIEVLDVANNRELTDVSIRRVLETVPTLTQLRISNHINLDDIAENLKQKLKY